MVTIVNIVLCWTVGLIGLLGLFGTLLKIKHYPSSVDNTLITAFGSIAILGMMATGVGFTVFEQGWTEVFRLALLVGTVVGVCAAVVTTIITALIVISYRRRQQSIQNGTFPRPRGVIS